MKKAIITITTLLFTLFLSITVNAAPITDMPKLLTQPDGTEFICLMSGDEFFNYYHDENGYIIKQADDGWFEYCLGDDSGIITSGVRVGDEIPDGALTKETVYDYASSDIEEAYDMYNTLPSSVPEGLENEPGNETFFSGDFNNIVIFVCFSDESDTLDTYVSSNISKLYNTGYTPDSSIHSEISIKNFFSVATNNHINLNTTFYPTKNGTVYCYKANNPRSYYIPKSDSNQNGYDEDSDSERRIREFDLLQEILEYAQTVIPNDLNLDKNNDGKVDSITFLINGEAEGWNDLLWSHKWSLFDRTVNLNGARVYTYSFTILDSVFTDNTGINSSAVQKSLNMGTICHEMMHTFGMPDLYDYVYQSSRPIGYYDLMASTNDLPQMPTVYTRERWGIYASGKTWVDGQTREITSGLKQTLTLKTSSSNDGIIAYKIPGSLTGYTATSESDGAGSRTIYIEYRGISGSYDCEREDVVRLGDYITKSSYYPFYKGVSTGLLVYETDNGIASNVRRNICNHSTATKDCYAVWAYRTDGTLSLQPTAFKEGTGDVFISLTNGTIIKISNIDEADDKSTVTFDIEIFVNGDPTYNKTTNGFYYSEGATASALLTSLTKQYISWNSGNCNYYNGTPSTNTQLTTTILDKNGQTVSGSTVIGTGYTIKVTSAKARLVRTFETVVEGDIDGNAKTDVNDMILLKKHLSSENGTLKGAALFAADLNKSSDVTVTDLSSFAAAILTITKQ